MTSLRTLRVALPALLFTIACGPSTDIVANYSSSSSKPKDDGSEQAHMNELKEKHEKANALRRGAQELLRNGKGPECLTRLNSAAGIDPDGAKDSYVARIRGRCLMLVGKCEEGKTVLAGYYKGLPGSGKLKGERLEAKLKATANDLCPSNSGDAKERVTRASAQIARALERKDFDACDKEASHLVSLIPALEPVLRKPARQALKDAAACLAKGKKCDKARTYYLTAFAGEYKEENAQSDVPEDARKASEKRMLEEGVGKALSVAGCKADPKKAAPKNADPKKAASKPTK